MLGSFNNFNNISNSNTNRNNEYVNNSGDDVYNQKVSLSKSNGWSGNGGDPTTAVPSIFQSTRASSLKLGGAQNTINQNIPNGSHHDSIINSGNVSNGVNSLHTGRGLFGIESHLNESSSSLGKGGSLKMMNHYEFNSVEKNNDDRPFPNRISLKLLTVAHEEFPIRTVYLPVNIGRAVDPRIRPSPRNALFSSSYLSRNHAVIRVDMDGHLLVEDLGSCNGTFVNGRPLIPGTPLSVKEGDLIQFGSEDESAESKLFYINLSFCGERTFCTLLSFIIFDRLTECILNTATI